MSVDDNQGWNIVWADHSQHQPISEDWYQFLKNLDPITAIIAWEVLMGRVTKALMTLAQLSPAWDEFTFVQAVGNGNPKFPEDVGEIALAELIGELTFYRKKPPKGICSPWSE